MTKVQFKEFLYEKLTEHFGKINITKQDTEKFYNDFSEQFVRECVKEPVVTKIGKFHSSVIKGHNGINPKTKERIWLDDKYVLRFTASQSTRRIINNEE
jgi:nucleoid DNA-binding protein